MPSTSARIRMSSICISTSRLTALTLALTAITPPRVMALILTVALTSNACASSVSEKIVAGARRQAQEGANYDPRYFRVPYPNGDIPRNKGVCTDVLVRSLRNADIDLQKLIHEDMRRRFSKYPQRYGTKGPDSNIDHRRFPNQISYFEKYAKKLTTSADARHKREWKPGDIVYWKLDNGRDHCGVLSDRIGASGSLLVVHNLSKCVEEDCLRSWKITAHFRCPK